MPIYRDTILCELIRPEINNKLSVLGLFGECIFVPSVPTVLSSFAILQRWAPEPNEGPGTRFEMSFELRGPGLDTIRFAPYEVIVPAPPKPLIQAAVQLQGFPVARTGDYELITFINAVE